MRAIINLLAGIGLIFIISLIIFWIHTKNYNKPHDYILCDKINRNEIQFHTFSKDSVYIFQLIKVEKKY